MVPLTYKQLRRLEKMDREKARDQKLLTLAEEAIRALGTAGAGFGVGAGNAINGYLSGDAIAFAAKSVAGLAFLVWLVNTYPNFAHFLHLDTLLLQWSPNLEVTTGPGTVPSSASHPGAQPYTAGGATFLGAGGGNTVFIPGQGPQPQTAQV